MQHHPFKVELIESIMLTPSVVQLTFRRSNQLPFVFVPGQFITFLLPHPSGKVVPRSYSLANSPEEPYKLEIAIAPVQDGFATHILFNLKIGDQLDCVGPRGKLVLEEGERPAQYILVATGTGVAPYRSMLPAIARRLEKDKKLKVTLLLGVRYPNELLYAEDFIAFAQRHTRFHFFAYLSRADRCDRLSAKRAYAAEFVGDTERKNRSVLAVREDLSTGSTSKLPAEVAFCRKAHISYHFPGYVQSAFESLNLNPMVDLVYLCGNPYMIDDSVAKLQQMGFSPKSIRREKYVSRGV